MRCKLFPAEDTSFSSQPWIFIIKPILFHTSGNQRPTAHRCHCCNNDQSDIFISIFLFMYLLNTVLESSWICNLGSCLSAHRSIASAMAQQRLCLQWRFHTFWGTVGDLWSYSVAGDHLWGFQCLTAVHRGALPSWSYSRLRWVPPLSILKPTGMATKRPPSPAVTGVLGHGFRFACLLCTYHFTIHWIFAKFTFPNCYSPSI